jgi:hypothetical protein
MMNRRTALKTASKSTAAILALPTTLLAGANKRAPKFARTMWHAAWCGDKPVHRELVLVARRDASDLLRSRPELAKWQAVELGEQILFIEAHSLALERIDVDEVWQRLTDALDGRYRAQKAGDVESEKRYRAITNSILHA